VSSYLLDATLVVHRLVDETAPIVLEVDGTLRRDSTGYKRTGRGSVKGSISVFEGVLKGLREPSAPFAFN
jgi:hypothetical protein